MKTETIRYRPIGTIRSPHQKMTGTPIQPSAALGVRGRIELNPAFQQGLKDLEGFSHIILIYHFDLVKAHDLRVTPYLGEKERGVFATRAPKRPNPVGVSVVRLVKIEGSHLEICDVDILDGTPLIDIKPFVPYFDQPEGVKSGWIEEVKGDIEGKKADDRFA